MAHAVFIQNPQSIYADRPGEAYNFPAQYLSQIEQTVGEWVVYYESRRGAFGYVGVQKVEKIVPDPMQDQHYFAMMDVGSLLEFERTVPRLNLNKTTWESMLRGEDGLPYRAGANTLAVRLLPPVEFSAIVNYGLTELDDVSSMPRLDSVTEAHTPFGGLADPSSEFIHKEQDRVRVLTSRTLRDASFARQVKRAYENKCAISGLALTNGGGRPEVEAAHIRPVNDNGPDTVRNGIALSGTLHWMFDRGLLSIAEDLTILVSHNKVPKEVANRLIGSNTKLTIPVDPRLHPHPEYLRYHREQVYGQL